MLRHVGPVLLAALVLTAVACNALTGAADLAIGSETSSTGSTGTGVVTDGSCATAGTDPSGPSYRYNAASGCSVKTPPTVLGSVAYTSPRTLCCTSNF